MRLILNWMAQPKNMLKSWIVVLWAASIYKMGYDNALKDWDQQIYTQQFVQARQSVDDITNSEIRKVKNVKKQIGLTFP